ncbi:MAG TPA: M20/M25/M40 family metallo-hydrolase, partial [Thermomicrobiales bacterium]|nr:M20/M25/M40 family metallo-hydrolase [Thermomicrobiales bacterium]
AWMASTTSGAKGVGSLVQKRLTPIVTPVWAATSFAGLERLANDVAAQTGVTIGVNRFWTSEPTPFAPEVVDAIQAAAEEMGIATRRCWSGAGHDAKYIQEIAPSAMIFARSINGLSHCEQEYSTPEDLEAGANVLLRAALRLAGIEGERTRHKRG